jgi:hypothetical protein
VDNVDLKVYEKAIDYVFDNNDIKNVAISGAYGSGKSSILASYKKKHGNLKFLHISLAHFEASDGPDDEIKTVVKGENENIIKELVLEGKILNQLMHQISPNDIPQTNFRVKQKVAQSEIWVKTLTVILSLLSFLHFKFFDKWSNFVNLFSKEKIYPILLPLIDPYSRLISSLVIIFAIGAFVYSIINIQKNKNLFRRISVQGNEIEIFEKSDESYFDKYLNEVLYLFENANVDVIVFEDMDRFNASRIFERLHEVNTLVNNQLRKNNNSVLRFFYLLRDDIFVSKDRTKFFDYIIPVVPVVDSSNSYNKLISFVKESGIINKFDKSFLKGLSLYIDEMRILKNIYNEFIIYYNQLNTTELNCNKMLAIIAYKNLFPRDFSELQLNKGFVFTLFEKKEEFIREATEQIKALISVKKAEIANVKKENLESIKELDDIYELMNSRLPSQYTQRMSESTKVQQWHQTIYPKRKSAIEVKLKNGLFVLEQELSDLEYELSIMYSKKLHEIITRDNVDIIFKINAISELGNEKSFDDIKESDSFALLKYLIWQGYIDENYPDYMTYFYDNSLSRTDKIFLRSVTDKKAKEYTYEIQNPQMILDMLSLADFDQIEILNFDLLQHLLKTSNNNSFLVRFLLQLKNTKNFKFIGAYLNSKKEMAAYVKNLNQYWPEMLHSLIQDNKLSQKQLKLYSLYTLYYCEDDIINAVNIENCLTCYISENASYMEIMDPDVEKIIYCFDLLKVQFISIDYESADKNLFNGVYKSSNYEINADNLTLILEKVYEVEDLKDIAHKNYTLVLSQPDSALAHYVNKNISEYIKVVLTMCNGAITDDENIALIILNHSDITSEQKHAYIHVLKTNISLLNKVEDKTLWEKLINQSIINYSEINIAEYFCNKGALDSAVIDFINNSEKVLNFSIIKSDFGEDFANEFFDAIIICNELSTIKYIQILSSLGYFYDEFNVLGVDDDKLRALIDEDIIRMTPKTLIFIRENYINQLLYFIEKSLRIYVEIMTTELFLEDELLQILSLDVDDDIKVDLLKFTSKPLSLSGNNYSVAVQVQILSNNFDPSDLPILIFKYEETDTLIQPIVYELSVKYIMQIINTPHNISDKLLRELISGSELLESNKINLFISILPKINKDVCKDYFKLLGLYEYLKIFELRSRPKFLKNSTNEMLLIALKNRGWIYDFEVDADKVEFYKIVRKKMR